MKIYSFTQSILDLYNACPRKYYFAEKLYRKPLQSRTYLDQGTLIHAILQRHYDILKLKQDGSVDISYDSIIVKAIEHGRFIAANVDIQLKAEEIEECIKNYRDYAHNYPNDGWIVVAVEQPFMIPIYEIPDQIVDGQIYKEGFQINLAGKIDLIRKLEIDGSIALVDHKKEDQITERNILGYQAGTYSLATGIRSFIYNCVGFQTSKSPKDRMRRVMLSINESWLDDWKNQVIMDCLDLINSEAADFYRARFVTCNHMRGCIYRPVCQTTPDNRKYKLDSMYKVGEAHDPFK